MSKVYLAGRLDTGEGRIEDFANELEAQNHEVIEKWYLEGRLPKPYLSNLESSSPASEKMIKAASESDIFVLFPTDDILGAAVEFGAALGSVATNPDKIIAVVNAFQVRQSLFYAYPAVIAVSGLEEIRKLEWY